MGPPGTPSSTTTSSKLPLPGATTDDGGVNASAPPLGTANYFYMLPASPGYTPPPPPPANP